METPHPVPSDMNRVAVIGSTSSGKTTLAKSLATVLGSVHIEMDALRFLPGWKVRDNDDFRAKVGEATSQPRWVTDGNYSITRDLTWGRADTVIWLNYNLPLILRRLTRRTFSRWWNRTELWNTGNRENLIKHFIPNDESLYFWVLKTYWKRRRELPAIIARPEHAHLRFIIFTTPRETDLWLKAVERDYAKPIT